MKCIKNLVNGEISRVSDQEAAEKAKTQKFQYCSKAEWKRAKAVSHE